MKFSKFILAGAAAFALVACGKKDASSDAPRSESSRQAGKADAGSPLDVTFALKGAEAVDIDAILALLPEKSRPTYESAEFDKGLGATVVTNMRFADADDGEAVTVERAEFYGVDLDAINRVDHAEDVGPDAPFETIFQKVRLYNVASEYYGDRAKNEKANISIGGVELDKLQVRQGGAESDGAGEEGARFVNALNMAGVYFKDISIVTESDDAPSVSLAAPDIRFVGFGGGKLDAVIANDLEYKVAQTDKSRQAIRDAMGPQGAMMMNGLLQGILAPDNQRIVVKAFEWRDLDFSGLLSWGLKGEEPPMSAENLMNLGTMKMADMETYIGEKRAVYMKEATVTAMDFTWLIPSNFRADTKDAVYDLTAYMPASEEAAISLLKEHGLDNVKGNGFIEWVWNSKNGSAKLDYVAETDGLADISLAFGLGGLKLKDMAASQETGDKNVILSHGAFKNLSLTITDEKALEAFFALSALQMGGAGEDLRQSVPAMIRLSSGSVASINPRVSDYVDAVADFIAKGGAIEVLALPAEPIAFIKLQADSATAPNTLPDVLNLTVTHKEK